MDETMIRRVIEAVRRVCEAPGFGAVTIVIEKGRPRLLETSEREWLEDRQGSPGRAAKPTMA